MNIMVRFIPGVLLCFLCATTSAFALEREGSPGTCQMCGMSRSSFDHSRMMIVYADGAAVETCSLHCAVIAMDKQRSKQIKSIMVADFNTGKLINAKTAAWVIGSRHTGVMSSVTQLAFENKQAAQAFMKGHSGILATFDQALKLARMESTSHEH